MNLSAKQRELVAAAVAAGAHLSGQQLARATRQAWEVSTEVFSDGPAERFRLFLGGTVQPHYGALLPAQDGKPLAVLVVFPVENAKRLAEDFTRGYGAWLSKIDDVEMKAVGEIANIVSHAFAGALGDALRVLVVLAAPPILSRDTRLGLLEGALARFTGTDCFMMVARVTLSSGKDRVEGHLAIMIDRGLLLSLLEAAAPS